MKTSELTGAALDWAVACALGALWQSPSVRDAFFIWPGEPVRYSKAAPSYSTNWSQGGPIIEREKIDVAWGKEGWYANMYWRGMDIVPAGAAGESLRAIGDGPTPLIAAMRCFVASRLGDEVDIPKELT